MLTIVPCENRTDVARESPVSEFRLSIAFFSSVKSSDPLRDVAGVVYFGVGIGDKAFFVRAKACIRMDVE